MRTSPVSFILMTAALISLASLSTLTHGAELKSHNIGDYDFSLANIEKLCKAHRLNNDILDIQCNQRYLKPVERLCEGYITGGLDSITLNCRGDLWEVGQQCKIEMRSAAEGEFNCRL